MQPYAIWLRRCTRYLSLHWQPCTHLVEGQVEVLAAEDGLEWPAGLEVARDVLLGVRDDLAQLATRVPVEKLHNIADGGEAW